MSKLRDLPNLTALSLNLVEETQVDLVMQSLPNLVHLNGLEVEREDDDEELAAAGDFGTTDDEFEHQQMMNNGQVGANTDEDEGNDSDELMARGAVKEYPELEDQYSYADQNQAGAYQSTGRDDRYLNAAVRGRVQAEADEGSDTSVRRGGRSASRDPNAAMLMQDGANGVHNVSPLTRANRAGGQTMEMNWGSLSRRVARPSDPLAAFEMPVTEYKAFENPCTRFVQDYRNILTEHGVSTTDVARLASGYDAVRQCRRKHPLMIEHNKDKSVYDYFCRNFGKLIAEMKAQRDHHPASILDLQTKRGLLATLHEVKQEYLQHTDPELQKVDDFVHEMTSKLHDEALQLYQQTLQGNPLHAPHEALKKQVVNFELKYQKELKLGQQKDLKIQKLRKKLEKLKTELGHSDRNIRRYMDTRTAAAALMKA